MLLRSRSAVLTALLVCSLLLPSMLVGCSASYGGNGGGGGGTAKSDFQSHTVNSIPDNEDDFVAMRNELCTTPQGAAVAFVVALEIYTRDEALGLTALARVMDRDRLTDGDPPQLNGTEAARFAQYIGERPYVAHHNFKQATPGNNYEMGNGPWTVETKEQPNDVTATTARIFVVGTGADSPRPLRMEKNNRGLWKIKEWSSFQVGVRPPNTETDDNY